MTIDNTVKVVINGKIIENGIIPRHAGNLDVVVYFK